MKKTYILIPNANNFDSNFKHIPKPPRKAKFKIILLDDFHTFFSTNIARFPDFIKQAIEADYTIWANTITGDEFENIRDHMSDKLLSQFIELHIHASLSKEEAIRIAKTEGITKLPDWFMGNIGEIFDDRDLQTDRYEKLDYKSKLLLKVFKQLYMVGIYRPPFKMLKENVYKLVKFYEPGISGDAIVSSLEVLLKKEFISESNDLCGINFEENYLRTVVEPKMKVKDFMTDIGKVFPLNAATFTQGIQKTTSYEDAKNMYHSMLENNIQPNARLFYVLIRKSDNSDIGLDWLAEMDKFQLEPDEFTLTALLRTTKNDIEKLERLDNEMQKRGMPLEQSIDDMFASRRIQSNITTYNNLMCISDNYAKALMLFQEMNKIGMQPDVKSYSILIKLSNDFETGMRLFKEMEKENIKPDSVAYNTLIDISKDFNKGLKCLYNMRESGVSPDIYTLNTLLQLSDNFEKVKPLLENMNILGIKPDNITVRSLFDLFGDFNRKLKLFEEMKREGLKPETSTYAFIIHASDDFEKGIELLEQMKKEDVKPDASVYGTLIYLSNDFEKGMELLNQMKEEAVKPDVKAYGTLIKLSNDYRDGKAMFDQMIKDGIKPNVKIYTNLIKLSDDSQKGWELLYEMDTWGLKPNVWTFNTLIWLHKYEYQVARGILDYSMTDAKVKPNVVTYTELMNISRNYQIASLLLDEMVKKGIKPNNETYHVLEGLKN